MENILGLKELRENMEKYISQIKRGKSFVVVRRSKPLFRILSLDKDSQLWEPVIDFTAIKRSGISIDDLLARI